MGQEAFRKRTRMALSSWITTMLPSSSAGMGQPQLPGQGHSLHQLLQGGDHQHRRQQERPHQEGPQQGLVVQNRRVKRTGSAALQLKPWNSRDRHRVAKAMVAPAASPP